MVARRICRHRALMQLDDGPYRAGVVHRLYAAQQPRHPVMQDEIVVHRMGYGLGHPQSPAISGQLLVRRPHVRVIEAGAQLGQPPGPAGRPAVLDACSSPH